MIIIKFIPFKADKDCPSEDTCFTYQDKFVKKVEKKKQIKLKKGGQDELNFRTNFFGYSEMIFTCQLPAHICLIQ